MHDVKENICPKHTWRRKRLHTKNTHQLPCPQESHCTKKFPTAKATNESKHSETWITTGQFHARMSKNTRVLLNFTTALITSEFRATRTRREYALGRLPEKRRAPGIPSRHPASLAPVLILRHHPLFIAVSTNFVVDLRFLWQECMSA
jgi:hypothetical protein